MFGGERFVDLIGEISLIKDFGRASEIMMTDEEREEMERQMNEHLKSPTTDTVTGASDESGEANPATSASESQSQVASSNASKAERQKHKLTPEQRKKLDEFEKEKVEKEQKRITDLTEKLKDRIRPFVNARNPGCLLYTSDAADE